MKNRRYKQALLLPPSDFKRLSGVSFVTFKDMKKIVLAAKVGKGGSHSKLTIPDQILLTLQYWREYRTFFHLAQDWGIHELSNIAHKKTKKKLLTPDRIAENRQQAKVRVGVENVIRCLKIWRILSSRYCNRRKRFGFRANLIAGIYNYELKLAA